MTPARFTNLLLAAILGLLVGWFLTVTSGCSVDVETPVPIPESRCEGISFSSCVARVNLNDGGTD